MKKLISAVLIILLATTFIAVMPTEAEGAIYGDTVRLHILASSDSEEDQALKIKLRDAVLSEYGESLSLFESVEDARCGLYGRLDEIREFADGKIQELGYEYKTEVTLTEEWYETRDYGDFSLPCGYYTSLRIIIGEGEGQNWWCVMFPPMCTEIAASDKKVSYTEAEKGLVAGGKYRLKFKTLELINEYFFK